MSDKISRPPQTLAQRREARETKRFVAASVPVSSPTRIAAPATASAKAQPNLNAKQLQDEIIRDFKAKYGHVPDLDHVLSEVWKQLGFRAMSARQKRQFWER
jgi:hypothetical protein